MTNLMIISREEFIQIASVLLARHSHVRTDLLAHQFSSYRLSGQPLTNFHVATRLRTLGTGG